MGATERRNGKSLTALEVSDRGHEPLVTSEFRSIRPSQADDRQFAFARRSPEPKFTGSNPIDRRSSAEADCHTFIGSTLQFMDQISKD